MKQYCTLIWATVLSLVFCSCTKTDEMQSRIDEYMPVIGNPMVKEPGDSSRKAEVIALLNREYPAAPPISQDSAQRILSPSLPDSIGPLKLNIKEPIEYIFPKDVNKKNPSVAQPTQRYFSLFVEYMRPKVEGKPNDGFFLFILEHGYFPQWLGRVFANKIAAGETFYFEGLNMRNQFEYRETIDYQNHKWAVWKSKPHPATYNGVLLPLPTINFITLWNDRFAIIIHSSDTTKTTPEYTEQIINYDWLEKLGYPGQ